MKVSLVVSLFLQQPMAMAANTKHSDQSHKMIQAIGDHVKRHATIGQLLKSFKGLVSPQEYKAVRNLLKAKNVNLNMKIPRFKIGKERISTKGFNLVAMSGLSFLINGKKVTLAPNKPSENLKMLFQKFKVKKQASLELFVPEAHAHAGAGAALLPFGPLVAAAVAVVFVVGTGLYFLGGPALRAIRKGTGKVVCDEKGQFIFKERLSWSKPLANEDVGAMLGMGPDSISKCNDGLASEVTKKLKETAEKSTGDQEEDLPASA